MTTEAPSVHFHHNGLVYWDYSPAVTGIFIYGGAV